MSDLCMYELEDVVWDEFGQSDDHVVPYPSDEHANEHAFQGDVSKKSQGDVVGVSSNTGDQYVAECVSQENEVTDFPTLNRRRNTMLEKDPWSHALDGVFSASCDSDSIKEVTSLASDNARIFSHCIKSNNIDSIGSEFCAGDSILSDRCTAVDSSSYNYLLSQISQTDNDLSFFNNDCEEKESSDLLYYGWPDIGNFEDVDSMFRSCDSSFGGAGKEDELGWFSSSDAIEGSEDALKSDYKFSCPKSNALKNISENHEPSELNNGSSSIIASVSYKASSLSSEDDVPATLGHLSFVNGSNQISESKGVEFNGGVQFKFSTINHSKNDDGMINLHKKQPKHQNQSGGKRKNRCLENGGSFLHLGKLQNKDIRSPHGDTSYQVLSSCIQQRKKKLGRDSFGYPQSNIPHLLLDYCHPSDQTTVGPTLSGIKSENIGRLTSLPPKESSYASNQVQSMESSHDPSFEATAITLNDKKEKLQRRQGCQPSLTSNQKQVDLLVQASIRDPVSVQKQVHHSANELENESFVEGVSIGFHAELGSSYAQESSSIKDGLDEISLEATSFRQLRQVMQQLDLRTKLCIRDSLYRLARSAEQRHNHANLNGGSVDDRDTSGALMSEGTNKCSGFIDMETDTNPIDRSVAHLLFHRPSDPSVKPSHNASSLKSHTMIHDSITTTHMMTEQLVCHEETAAETDRKVADH